MLDSMVEISGVVGPMRWMSGLRFVVVVDIVVYESCPNNEPSLDRVNRQWYL